MASLVRRLTSIELELRYYDFDEQLADAIATREVNAAIARTWTVLRGCEKSHRGFERLADLLRPDGANDLYGVFIVRRDSELTTLKELDGRTIALGPDSAYEKSHAARRALKEAGAAPGSVRVIDACAPVAAAVLERTVDAGVVSNYVVDFGGLATTGSPDEFRVIGRTASIPFITFAVSTEVDAESRGKLRQTLLEMHDERIPSGLCTTGFVAAEPCKPEELKTK
jgi:ABC-type phosphate/phosphonate transport system substrate-binding protein